MKKKPKAQTGHLWVYSKDSPARQGTPRSEGVENGYFGVPTPTGEMDESLEGRLAELEDQAGEVLLMAPNQTFVWSQSYRKRMADYVALIYARARSRLTASEWVCRAVSKDMLRLLDDDNFMREMADEYTKMYKAVVDVSVLKDSFKKTAENMVTRNEKRSFFLSELLRTAEWVSKEVLLQRAWQVWKAPEGQEFVTSDSPVFTMLPINDDFAPGYAFNIPEVLVAFPLNSTASLVIGADGKPFKDVDAQKVDRTNEVQIRSMTQNVYSRTKSKFIEDAVTEYGSTSKVGESAFVLPGDFLPKMKEFLRKRLEAQQQADTIKLKRVRRAEHGSSVL